LNNEFDELTKNLAQSVTRRAALKKFGVGLASLTLACFAFANPAHASTPNFTTIDYPGAVFTDCVGINRFGDIVGSYYENNSDSTGGSNGSQGHGFLLSGGVYRAIDFSGADYTDAWRINDNGQIVGRYKSGNGAFHVFLLTIASGAFTSIDYPGATQTAMGDFTQMGGLNNNGDIASDFCSSSSNCEVASFGSLHGFVLRAGTFTSLDVPGAAGTVAFGINERGVVVGGYTDGHLRVHGFLRTP